MALRKLQIRNALGTFSVKDIPALRNQISTIFFFHLLKHIGYYRVNSGKKDLLVAEEQIADSFTDEEYNDTTKGLDCCLIGFVNQLSDEYRDIIIDVEMNGIKKNRHILYMPDQISINATTHHTPSLL